MKTNTSTSGSQAGKVRFRRFRRLIAGVLTGAVALLVSAPIGILHAAGNGSDVNPGVLPPQAHAYGKTYGEWAADWLKFVYSVPFDQNPEFGQAAPPVVGQSGPVSLIAGTDGEITVPVGQGLFIPFFRVTFGTCPEETNPFFQPAPGQTIAERLTEIAAFVTATGTNLSAIIDGVPLENLYQYHATSGVLDDLAFGPGYEQFIAPCGPAAGQHQDIAEGFWLMLAPLSKGQHTFDWALTLGPPINLSFAGTLQITVE